jgi:hypothetical protein
MAGRYQGYHRFADKDGEFEVYWDWDRTGWFWRPRSSDGSLTEGKAVGPFVTSTEAFNNAMNEPRAEQRAVKPDEHHVNKMKPGSY